MDYQYYQYIEDNGGGLHLFVFADDYTVVGGITNLEYAEPGEWLAVQAALDSDPVAEIAGWDGHMSDQGIDAAEFYKTILEASAGYTVVAERGALYPDAMGAAAQRYFGVESD